MIFTWEATSAGDGNVGKSCLRAEPGVFMSSGWVGKGQTPGRSSASGQMGLPCSLFMTGRDGTGHIATRPSG